MGSKQVFLLLLAFFLTACNMPGSVPADRSLQTTAPEVLWNLSSFADTDNGSLQPTGTPEYPAGTPTPQLYSAVDFDAAFREAAEVQPVRDQAIVTSGEDQALWLFFDPVERSSAPLETLYAAFENSGTSTWTEGYYLEFYAGVNPSSSGKVLLGTSAAPGNRATFAIPISDTGSSWKSCWQLKNADSVAFYEFCYNHGDGSNDGAQPVQADTGSGGGQQSPPAFTKIKGTAPARFTSEELAAEVVSTSPSDGHTFQAYDHFESLSVNIRNDGTETWDSSYTLVFYSGYNWMHGTSFSVPETVDPGETVTITMPMEIYEDNDKWVTCWYLSTPDGKNLADFCFNYYTRSK